ncbi:hypothetical protein [Alteribacillus sp. HJP-4]|uniref:hypothetical protein n=1 Tax=Alteribacillus sp. HJP-4 TaxID=2775394 RepID=UPI0035CCEE10
MSFLSERAVNDCCEFSRIAYRWMLATALEIRRKAVCMEINYSTQTALLKFYFSKTFRFSVAHY